MKNLFNQLQEYISPVRKAQLVKRNMLPNLARQLAIYNIQDLSELSHYVKRIEDVEQAAKEMNLRKPSESPNFRFYPQRREVSEIRPSNVHRDVDRNTREEIDPCWNCREVGHVYTNCTYPKMRVFCYLCGEVGQLANSCNLCKEKGRPGPARNEGRLDQSRM